jgi:hypothetical protein
MTTWFGDYSLAEGETLRWRMGPKTMWVSRAEREWRVATSEGQDPLEAELEIARPDQEPSGEELRLFRFVAPPGDRFRVLPALPDRPVIIRSDDPVLILPGSKVSFYISCPLWVQVWIGGATEPAIDAPVFRPSDTWFGSDTIEGELCYASRTSARQSLESLPIRHHRAVSEVQIRNQASTSLQLQRLKLPVPQLSLFASESGALWTEKLTFDRDDKASGAHAVLSNRPPTGLELSPLNQPRRPLKKGFLVDAFGGLWS